MTKEEILNDTVRCTIEEDADLDNPENFYFKYTDVLEAMEKYAQEQVKLFAIPAVSNNEVAVCRDCGKKWTPQNWYCPSCETERLNKI